MLLEVLIALLIFALGVLGLVGLQANAVKQSGQAKYRADATLLANELIGRMWVSNRSFATLQADFGSAAEGAEYKAWLARVGGALPGADSHPPQVVVTQVEPLPALSGAASSPAVGLTPSSRVTITMRWQAPSDPASMPPRNLVLVTEIK
jgi:type IV pilus assembly protein PilV